MPEQRFTIDIIPVNNAAPEIKKAPSALRVSQGGTIPLGPNALTISDVDTPQDELIVTLDRAPVAGHVTKRHRNVKEQLRTGEIQRNISVQLNDAYMPI